MLGILLLVGGAGQARAEEPVAREAPPSWHVGAGAGVGHAYAVIGLQLQLRLGHGAAFGSVSVPGLPPLVVGGGVRWYSGNGEGLVLSLHGTTTPPVQPIEPQTTLAATVGWRFRWALDAAKPDGRGLFFEAGVGPAVYHYVNDEGRVFQGFGSVGPVGSGGTPLPDIALAFGLEL
ncbi:MAG TPA: hypothetical protein VK447_14520 [Myxococcaceae bacterium]|nr:hypothetical protein [Myxococcaceae bacterium]